MDTLNRIKHFLKKLSTFEGNHIRADLHAHLENTWQTKASNELIRALLDEGGVVELWSCGGGCCGKVTFEDGVYAVTVPQPTVGAVVWRLLAKVERKGG